MVINTFFEKSNTIHKNRLINTALNPVTEICYGSNESYFIFYINIERIKEAIKCGIYPNTNKLKHTLHMFNCGGFAELRTKEELYNEINNSSKHRANSFSLNLYKLSKDWDGGRGYDYTTQNNEVSGSNYFYRKTYETWGEGEEIKNFISQLKPENKLQTISFDRGDENINIDITDYINKIINNEEENHGLCLTFDILFRNTHNQDTLEFVSFFTNNSKTYFQPYLQTTKTSIIDDNRNNVIDGKLNKLYLYTNNNIVLDTTPTCCINDKQIEVHQETKGVYYVEFTKFSEYDIMRNSINYDVWDITYNGSSMTIEQSFTSNKTLAEYLFEEHKNQEVSLFIEGISNNESIITGEIKKISVKPKVLYQSSVNLSVEIKYDIYIKEGGIKLPITMNQPLDKNTNELFFYLDSDSLVPNKYFIDFTVLYNNGSKQIFKEKVMLKKENIL